VEIFMQKGVAALTDGGWGENGAYRWGTALLFAGMLATGVLDVIVHIISNHAGVNSTIDATTVPEVSAARANEAKDAAKPENKSAAVVADLEAGTAASEYEGCESCGGCGPCADHVDHVRC
jgi:hypothetical protein